MAPKKKLILAAIVTVVFIAFGIYYVNLKDKNELYQATLARCAEKYPTAYGWDSYLDYMSFCMNRNGLNYEQGLSSNTKN